MREILLSMQVSTFVSYNSVGMPPVVTRSRMAADSSDASSETSALTVTETVTLQRFIEMWEQREREREQRERQERIQTINCHRYKRVLKVSPQISSRLDQKKTPANIA